MYTHLVYSHLMARLTQTPNPWFPDRNRLFSELAWSLNTLHIAWLALRTLPPPQILVAFF